MKNYRLDGSDRGYIEQWRKKEKKKLLHRRTDRFELVLKILHDGNISVRITKIRIYYS